MSKVYMNVDRKAECERLGRHDFRLLLVQRGVARNCFAMLANGFATACSRCGERP